MGFPQRDSGALNESPCFVHIRWILLEKSHFPRREHQEHPLNTTNTRGGAVENSTALTRALPQSQQGREHLSPLIAFHPWPCACPTGLPVWHEPHWHGTVLPSVARAARRPAPHPESLGATGNGHRGCSPVPAGATLPPDTVPRRQSAPYSPRPGGPGTPVRRPRHWPLGVMHRRQHGIDPMPCQRFQCQSSLSWGWQHHLERQQLGHFMLQPEPDQAGGR